MTFDVLFLLVGLKKIMKPVICQTLGLRFKSKLISKECQIIRFS
jgi:hypothetical protein